MSEVAGSGKVRLGDNQIKVRETLKGVIYEDLKAGGPNFHFEPCRPERKVAGIYSITPRGLKRELGCYSGNNRTALGYPDLAPGPSGSLASVP